MTTIAISDNIRLCNVFDRWLMDYVNLHKYSDITCQIKIFISQFSGTFGAFQIVLMTLDKVIAVQVPHKSKTLCTVKRAKILSVVNLLISAVFNLPFLFVSEQLDNAQSCIRLGKKGWYVTAYSFLYLVVNPMIPFVLLFLMNVVIIKTVWKSAGFRNGQTDSANYQITVMLVLVSITFIFLLLPFQIGSLYESIVQRPKTPKAHATYMLIFYVTFHVANLNYGVNFFLYLLSGSRFRKDFVSLFFCEREQLPPQAVEISSRSRTSLNTEGTNTED